MKYTAEDIRFTTKGNALYAFLLDVPAGNITIKSLRKNSNYKLKKIHSIRMLGSTEKLNWQQTGDALLIKRPTQLPAWKVLGFKVEFVK